MTNIDEQFDNLLEEYRVFRSLILIIKNATCEIAENCPEDIGALIDGFDMIYEKSNKLWDNFEDLSLQLYKIKNPDLKSTNIID